MSGCRGEPAAARLGRLAPLTQRGEHAGEERVAGAGRLAVHDLLRRELGLAVGPRDEGARATACDGDDSCPSREQVVGRRGAAEFEALAEEPSLRLVQADELGTDEPPHELGRERAPVGLHVPGDARVGPKRVEQRRRQPCGPDRHRQPVRVSPNLRIVREPLLVGARGMEEAHRGARAVGDEPAARRGRGARLDQRHVDVRLHEQVAILAAFLVLAQPGNKPNGDAELAQPPGDVRRAAAPLRRRHGLAAEDRRLACAWQRVGDEPHVDTRIAADEHGAHDAPRSRSSVSPSETTRPK